MTARGPLGFFGSVSYTSVSLPRIQKERAGGFFAGGKDYFKASGMRAVDEMQPGVVWWTASAVAVTLIDRVSCVAGTRPSSFQGQAASDWETGRGTYVMHVSGVML